MIWHYNMALLKSPEDPEQDLEGELGPPSQPETVRDPVKVTLLTSIIVITGILLFRHLYS